MVSKTLDVNGSPYYFFGNPDIDAVSRQMGDGNWEPNLNLLFKSIWDSDITSRDFAVLDVGKYISNNN